MKFLYSKQRYFIKKRERIQRFITAYSLKSIMSSKIATTSNTNVKLKVNKLGLVRGCGDIYWPYKSLISKNALFLQ